MTEAIYWLLFMILVPGTTLLAQENKNEIELGFGSSFGFGETIPFWLFSNQNSLLTDNPFNINSRLGYKRSFAENRKIDFAGGLQLVNRYSDRFDFYPEEAYGKLRLYFVEFQAGLIRESFGNHDKLLSSGGLLWSGNSRPFPKISLVTHEYLNIPFTHGYLQIKGGISHGWLGDNKFVQGTLLHHKYLYAKAGGELPINFSIGMHHFAQWGGISADPRYGKLPDDMKAFRKVFFGSSGGSDSPVFDQDNAAGNHLGSYNLRTDIKLSPVNIGLYWQSVFEDNSGRKNRNLWDGLYGMSFAINDSKLIKSVLLEYLSTTYQSGSPIPGYPADSIPPSYNDNYFNNWLYKMGWSYMDMGIGNPLITSPVLSKEVNSIDYFANNRVKAVHVGLAGGLPFCEYKLLYTYTRNHGTYNSPFEHVRNQTFFLLDLIFRELFKDTDLGFSIGIDRGELLGNSSGLYLNLVRKFVL